RRADGDAATLDQVQRMLEEQSGQAQRLIEELDRTVRVLRGEIEIRPKRCDLAQVVDDGIAAAKSRNAPNLRIERISPAAPIGIEADPEHLSAAVEELIDNAARFAGTMPIRVELEREGDAALVHVRDDGPGIPADRLEQLFEPFAAAESAESGWGIGLGYVRLVASAHRGSLQAAPGPEGKGLVMTLRLPVGG
ncbi:MAG TPA: HAMP domain-containing sensor histidine kinase, partial [Thermoanaerobaculia bacterium]|nr:HAMP domain-containing sensor histidine kinase [Thermoanaerobaculia bacterium]